MLDVFRLGMVVCFVVLVSGREAPAQQPEVNTTSNGTPLQIGIWTDVSVSVGTTASVVVPASVLRTGVVIANNGANLLCVSVTGTAGVSGSQCALGSVPVPTNTVWSELGNTGTVSMQAVSAVAVTSADNVTIWTR